MTYRVRFVTPRASQWFDVSAASPDDAAQECAFQHGHGAMHVVDLGRGVKILVALLDVEGCSEMFFAKVVREGLYRRGGVKPSPEVARQRIDDAWSACAKAIGWTRGVDELKEEWT